MSKTIWTTYVDQERLQAYVDDLERSGDKRDKPHVQELARELERAQIFYDSDQVPADLVTMRSKVRLKNLGTGKQMDCVLVYPEESDPDQYKISVLAPLGTAMLGCRIGDTFEVNLQRNVASFQVEEILYQPEAAGDSHL